MRTPGADRVDVLEPRDVPLGGPRAMTVRRTLPQRRRSLIGSWCFLDHFGPDRVAATGGMAVPRHPHTGLATVTWLFEGEVAHYDSAGNEALVRPGEVNLMVAGRGISHQEFSTPGTDVLHGTQLWFALPDATRHRPPSFERYVPDVVDVGGAALRVFIGTLAGGSSPVRTFTPPLLGAEIVLPPWTTVDLPVEPAHEHGVLLDSGGLTVQGEAIAVDHLVHLPVGTTTVSLASGGERARVLLIGGEPLGERIVMWWNFVGRDDAEIRAYRAAWQAEIGVEAVGRPGSYPDGTPYPRFGDYPQGMPAPLPAPVIPDLRLRPRG